MPTNVVAVDKRVAEAKHAFKIQPNGLAPPFVWHRKVLAVPRRVAGKIAFTARWIALVVGLIDNLGVGKKAKD